VCSKARSSFSQRRVLVFCTLPTGSGDADQVPISCQVLLPPFSCFSIMARIVPDPSTGVTDHGPSALFTIHFDFYIYLAQN
jgi:hypothetical protein